MESLEAAVSIVDFHRVFDQAAGAVIGDIDRAGVSGSSGLRVGQGAELFDFEESAWRIVDCEGVRVVICVVLQV